MEGRDRALTKVMLDSGSSAERRGVESSGGDRGYGMDGHGGVQEGTRLWGFE